MSAVTDDRTRPDLDDATVEGLGKLSEALETVDQARGLLYGFHQLTGKADRCSRTPSSCCATPATARSPTTSTATSSAAT